MQGVKERAILLLNLLARAKLPTLNILNSRTSNINHALRFVIII